MKQLHGGGRSWSAAGPWGCDGRGKGWAMAKGMPGHGIVCGGAAWWCAGGAEGAVVDVRACVCVRRPMYSSSGTGTVIEGDDAAC